MNINASVYLVVAALFLQGCALLGKRDVSAFIVNYEFLITDRPEAFLYELRLISRDPRAICVAINSWPSDSSALYEGKRAVLTSSNGANILASATASTGYVPGVMHKIMPGESLTGSVPYSLFGEPENIRDIPNRQLNYIVTPVLCSQH